MRIRNEYYLWCDHIFLFGYVRPTVESKPRSPVISTSICREPKKGSHRLVDVVVDQVSFGADAEFGAIKSRIGRLSWILSGEVSLAGDGFINANANEMHLSPRLYLRKDLPTQRQAFDFLGFTFYWGRSRRGHLLPKVKTSGKRLCTSLKRVQTWAREMRSRERLLTQWRIVCSKVRGHLRYYGVSFNHRALGMFCYQATRIMFKWLNRRCQRGSYNWEQFRQFITAYPLPCPAIYYSLF